MDEPLDLQGWSLGRLLQEHLLVAQLMRSTILIILFADWGVAESVRTQISSWQKKIMVVSVSIQQAQYSLCTEWSDTYFL